MVRLQSLNSKSKQAYFTYFIDKFTSCLQKSSGTRNKAKGWWINTITGENVLVWQCSQLYSLPETFGELSHVDAQQSPTQREVKHQILCFHPCRKVWARIFLQGIQTFERDAEVLSKQKGGNERAYKKKGNASIKNAATRMKSDIQIENYHRVLI